MSDLATDAASLIRGNTRIVSPRLLPEMRLYQAQDDVPLYRMGEDELAAMGIRTPFWAFAWAGGQALARYVLDHRAVVQGRCVLDFGAGSGVVGIAALAGAFDVVCTDIDPVAGDAIRLNADLNGVYLDVWREDVVGMSDLDVDVVLVGDVFYEKPIADRILPWLRELQADGRTVLIGDPGRFYLPNLGLEQVARYVSETAGLMEDTDLRNAGVWRLAAA